MRGFERNVRWCCEQKMSGKVEKKSEVGKHAMKKTKAWQAGKAERWRRFHRKRSMSGNSDK